MKIIGAVLLFFACMLAGITLGERKKKSVLECEAFLDLFRHARAEISCFDTPTKLIWRGFSNAVLEKNGFLPALKMAEAGDVYFDAFKTALDKTERGLCVSDEAKKVLRTFGGAIGKSLPEDQLSIIDLCISQMNDVLEKAKNDAKRDSKLYFTLGLSLGAVIFIMML